jgi:hypothetical protein
VAMPPPPLGRDACFAAGAHRFTVVADASAVTAHVHAVLEGLHVASEEPAARYRLAVAGDAGELRRDGEVLRRDADPAIVYEHLFWELNRRAVDDERLVYVHASAVERDGRAAVMCAPMESGKTTLCAGLIRAGCRYLTDEAVGIDPDTLLAQPYAKPLSIDPGSWQVLADLEPTLPADVAALAHRQWQVPAGAIHDDAYAPATPVALVVLPRYERGAPTQMERIPRAEALLALCEQSFTFARDPRRTLTVLAEVLRGADCARLVVGDLAEGVEAVLDALG